MLMDKASYRLVLGAGLRLLHARAHRAGGPRDGRQEAGQAQVKRQAQPALRRTGPCKGRPTVTRLAIIQKNPEIRFSNKISLFETNFRLPRECRSPGWRGQGCVWGEATPGHKGEGCVQRGMWGHVSMHTGVTEQTPGHSNSTPGEPEGTISSSRIQWAEGEGVATVYEDLHPRSHQEAPHRLPCLWGQGETHGTLPAPRSRALGRAPGAPTWSRTTSIFWKWPDVSPMMSASRSRS